MHVLMGLAVLVVQQDDAAKRISDRIDKVLEEHSARVNTELTRIVRQELSRAGAVSPAAAWEKLLADAALRLVPDGVTGDVKKACENRVRRQRLAEALAKAIPGDPGRGAEGLFETDERGLMRVRAKAEDQVKKALAASGATATPPATGRRASLRFDADPAFTDEDRKKLGLEAGIGVRVGGVTPDGPAEKAGLKVGDVVLKIGMKDFPSDRAEARELIQSLKPGEEADMLVLRDGERITLKITVEVTKP